MSWKAMAMIAIFAALLSGCATITGGTSEVVRFESTPSGAKLTVGGVQYTTPTDIPLSRKKEHVIVIEKEGYEKATVRLDRKFRGWATIGGNLLWIVPGVTIDGLTGAWYEFREKTIRVMLQIAEVAKPRPPEPLSPPPKPQILHRSYDEVAQYFANELAKAAGPAKVLAIFGFRAAGTDRRVALSAVLEDELEAKLVRLGVRVVERARLETVIRELKLQLHDLFEEKSAAKFGRFLGASGIIDGTIVDDHAVGVVRVSSRLIDVETASVLHAAQAELIRNATVIELLKGSAR